MDSGAFHLTLALRRFTGSGLDTHLVIFRLFQGSLSEPVCSVKDSITYNMLPQPLDLEHEGGGCEL